MSSSSDSDNDKEELQLKVILLGDGAVGKTSIATRFAQDVFAKQYKQTVGLDFYSKRITLPGDVDVTLQLWDIGGQSIGGKMLGNYIYGAHAVLLVYDVTSFTSFQNLEDWFRLVRKTFRSNVLPYVALIGNKIDLSHNRTIKISKHQDFAKEHKMHSFFVSAKTGDQVSSCYRRIAADLAGIVLTQTQAEEGQQVVSAHIVDHPNRSTPDDVTRRAKEARKKNDCNLQ